MQLAAVGQPHELERFPRILGTAGFAGPSTLRLTVGGVMVGNAISRSKALTIGPMFVDPVGGNGELAAP